ncbi:hypothetical protein ACFX1X_002310 [Malus domestica]
MAAALGGGIAVVIMGVSGAGKSTIGEMLARETNSSFIDADDFHPQSNKEKMRKGIPLTEEDRMPWLEKLRNGVRDKLLGGGTVILGCSALQKRYREILRSADPNYCWYMVQPMINVLDYSSKQERWLEHARQF